MLFAHVQFMCPPIHISCLTLMGRQVLALGLAFVALMADKVMLCNWLVYAFAALAEVGNLVSVSVAEPAVPYLVLSQCP